MTKILAEGFDYNDLKGQVLPTLSIDEYASTMGDDDEIVTLAFTVKGQQASEDLVDWFERGYEYVLDAEVSEGQVSMGKYLVFVEMNRRTSVPDRIVELVQDMETLTSFSADDWTVIIDGKEYPADAAQLKNVIVLSPSKYRQKHEEELNEMRNRAGLEPQPIFKERDSLIKDFLSKAGL